MTPSSINLAPSINQYEQVDGDFGLPATSLNNYEQVDGDFGLPATSLNNYEQVDGDFFLPATITNRYDEINDLRAASSPKHVEYLTQTSGLNSAPSQQDTKPPVSTAGRNQLPSPVKITRHPGHAKISQVNLGKTQTLL